MKLGCLDVCENFVDILWREPWFNDLYNVSCEVTSHPSDEAGVGRNMSIPPVDNIDAHKFVAEQSQLLLAFSAVDTDSEEDSEDEDEDETDPELLKAIEAEVRSRRAIKKADTLEADKKRF